MPPSGPAPSRRVLPSWPQPRPPDHLTTCTNPAPAHGGLACVGAPAEDQGCNADTCNTAAEELAGEPGVGGDAEGKKKKKKKSKKAKK